MKKYEDFIDSLQQDVEIPEKVWSQYEETLEDIVQLSGRKKEAYHKGMMKRWIGTAAVAGILVACSGMFFYSNPAAASKLPIIGKIFEQVKEDITYSGDYEEKEVLDINQTADVLDSSVYTAKCKGVTITASEVYCDGYSVYLTAKIESENGGFDNIPAHYTRRFEEKTSQSIHAAATWKINGAEEDNFSVDRIFEGKSVDDNTFIGMMKLDSDKYLAENGILQLQLSEILYDDENAANEDGIEPAGRVEGDWELTVPFTVDKQQCKEIAVREKNEDGYGIEKVFVSPYQVIVFAEAPYTMLSPDTYTKEDFEETWGRKNQEIIANGGKAVTYEDILNQKYYDLYELAMYNQDGESLEMEYCDGTKTIFAVQGHELSMLHIYMGDESVDMGLIKAANEQEAKEKAILDAEVDLK